MIAPPAFPRAAIPTQPVLSIASFGRRRCTVPAIDDFGFARYVNSGASAVALALKELGVKRGDEVLIPAYHGASVVEPAVWIGATPVFYRIHPSTQADFEDIDRRITARTRALIATHYFGFPQPIAQLRSLCDQYRIALIEDCTHAFFGKQDGRPLGSFGDFAIANSATFFPVRDGGVLASARRSLANIRIESGGVAAAARALVDGVEHAVEYRRLPLLRPVIRLPLALKTWLGDAAGRGEGRTGAEAAGNDPAPAFDAARVNKRQSAMSRRIMRMVDAQRIAEGRRANYLRIDEVLANTAGGVPLFHDLPADVVPFAYPYLVEQPEQVLDPMRMAGIPVQRFGEPQRPESDEDFCAVSADLARRVLLFPCHQELKAQELEWMLTRIRDIMKEHRA
jgi:dTDP-4-amino-4,6-dideoxygalactose transaminase